MLYYTAYEWQLVMQKLNDGDVNKCASDDEFLYVFISMKSEFKGACAKESKCIMVECIYSSHRHGLTGMVTSFLLLPVENRELERG